MTDRRPALRPTNPLDNLLNDLNLEPHSDPEILEPPELALLAGRACRRGFAADRLHELSRLASAITWLHPRSCRFAPTGFRGGWNSAACCCLALATNADARLRSRNAVAVAGMALAYLVGEADPFYGKDLIRHLEEFAQTEEGVDPRLCELASALAESRKRSGPGQTSPHKVKATDRLDEEAFRYELERILESCPVSPAEKSPLVLDVSEDGIFTSGGIPLRYPHGKSDRPVTLRNREGRLLLSLIQGRRRELTPRDVAAHLRQAFRKIEAKFSLVVGGPSKWRLEPVPTIGPRLRLHLTPRK